MFPEKCKLTKLPLHYSHNQLILYDYVVFFFDFGHKKSTITDVTLLIEEETELEKM